MGFWSGIGRIFRGIGYLFGYKANKTADSLALNPGVIAGTYDHIVAEKRKRIQTFKDSISKMVSQQEQKKDTLKGLTDDITKLENMKAGALAKAKAVASKYGGDAAKTQADPDYVKHQGAYRDFSNTLDEKNKRAKELESDVNGFQKNIGDYTVQIQGLMRELEKIAQEKNETIADVISAKEQQQVADIVSNLAEDTTGKDLQAMRDMRSKARASAKVSQNLAGLDTKASDAEYEQAASATVHDDEFSKLMGFAADKPAEAAPAEPAKVSET